MVSRLAPNRNSPQTDDELIQVLKALEQIQAYHHYWRMNLCTTSAQPHFGKRAHTLPVIDEAQPQSFPERSGKAGSCLKLAPACQL
ncbi:hypothetical protein [Anditalea andensis]|uniref:hypothetical protein n=1 Tax=Anditalea andensis TaxID=1048983 RepID=UPI000558C842|nr:hypothetical protein [Anditalea andensis]